MVSPNMQTNRRSSPSENKPLVVTVVVALFMLASLSMMVTASHGDEFEASFSTSGGNEWWVEVDVSANHDLAGVEARANEGSWQALEKSDWGAWAASFHVPEGSIVEFRAHSATGETDMSGQYRWPSGEPVDEGEEFVASFTTSGGNEWWVQVKVAANDPLAGVEARANEGSWHALEKRDWGAWAASFHVPDGSIVEFRAHSATGETDMSGQYRWPSGEPVDEGEEFAASFTTSGGNEWWVQVKVAANDPLAGVEARANEGSWHALEKRDWGAWAASFHVPDGSIVEFRAHSETGETDMSGQYRWPSGDPVDEGGPDDLNAAFGPKAGNDWWIETHAIADSPIVSVDARAGGGAWHALQLRDWLTWAGSFHVPEGSIVEFRAMDEDGRMTLSAGYEWPHAEPVEEDVSEWPREGAYAHYKHGWGVANDGEGDIDLIFVHHEGSWRVMCTGTINDNPFFDHARFAPPSGPTDVAIGDEVQVGVLSGCNPREFDLTVEEERTHDTRQNGDSVTIETWYGLWVPDCTCDYHEADWEKETGLVVDFRDGMTSWAGGELQDTNAPIG